ncbi:hypothetical protein ATANTOWER_021502 [Ataeniobius toweri]|uniref:Transmembrane protein n=1 Tax=Ataeniobius toweri TaxID=208326 RepID=A0ABU7CHW6_9TELE|nr:hypothetical protein [Ataeniobius toweri]
MKLNNRSTSEGFVFDPGTKSHHRSSLHHHRDADHLPQLSQTVLGSGGGVQLRCWIHSLFLPSFSIAFLQCFIASFPQSFLPFLFLSSLHQTFVLSIFFLTVGGFCRCVYGDLQAEL